MTSIFCHYSNVWTGDNKTWDFRSVKHNESQNRCGLRFRNLKSCCHWFGHLFVKNKTVLKTTMRFAATRVFFVKKVLSSLQKNLTNRFTIFK